MSVAEEATLADEFQPYGLGWRAVVCNRRVAMTVNKLRRTGGNLTAYVEVEYARPRADGGGRLLLAGERLNLSDGRARTALANRLTQRVDGLEWRNIVDAVCIEIQRRDDAGEPVIEVGNLPPSRDGGWLVQDFLERNQSHSLFGDGEVGKSWIGTALAVSVETATEVIPGYRPLHRGAALIVDYETDAETVNGRIGQIARGIGLDPPDIAYLRMDGPFVDHLERIMTECQQRNVVLVVVDSVEAAMAGSRDAGSEANEPASRMNQALRKLGRTVLLIDHINATAAASKGLAGKAYGNIFKRNWVRLAYELKQVREPTTDGYRHLGLYCTKRNNGPRFDPVGLRWEINEEVSAWQREEISEPELAVGLPAADQIDAFLRQYGPATATEIADGTGLPTGTVRPTLMRRSDRFQKTGSKWDLVRDDEPSELPW